MREINFWFQKFNFDCLMQWESIKSCNDDKPSVTWLIKYVGIYSRSEQADSFINPQYTLNV